MLVVVANSQDRIASAAVARWSAAGAGLLSCRDLSTDGWRYRPGSAATSVAVVGGRHVRARDIDAIVVRRVDVSAEEPRDIVADDRAYVAQEMTAFLAAWLTEMPCPVLNRPTPTCLGGPGWSTAEWVLVTASLGIPFRPHHLRLGPSTSAPTSATRRPASCGVTVSVVGDQCLGSDDRQLITWARRLADFAGVELLSVHFRSGQFVDADLWPDLSQPAIAQALVAYLASGAHRRQ